MYDLESIGLTVAVFDMTVLVALWVTRKSLGERFASALRLWMIGLALCILSTSITVFANQLLPASVRGAVPHVILISGLYFYWLAVRRFRDQSTPNWAFYWLLVVLPSVWVAIETDRRTAVLIITVSAIILHLLVASAARKRLLMSHDHPIDSQSFSSTHTMPQAYRFDGRWVIAAGFSLVAIALVYRVAIWWLGLVQIENVTFERALLRIFTALTNVLGSLGFALMCAERALGELHHAALTDTLTGLANRRAILQHCTKRIATEAGALVMIDVDHFKPINDRYGHLFGDTVLTELAKELQRHLPNEEDVLLARFGGEEFLLWLPKRNLPAAQAVAESLRIAAAEMILDSGPRVTISLGVAGLKEITARDSVDATLTHLLQTADQQLYFAKAAGRNAVRGEWMQSE